MSNGDDGRPPDGTAPFADEPLLELTPEERLEQEREALLGDVAAGRLSTMERRVAWLLNNYPATRNSDIALQIKYWQTFVPDYDGGPIDPDDLYWLPRLTSIARSRATVQNRLKLFQASAEVRARRGTLAEEERERARQAETAYPVFAVYADESGKTQDHLVVGSLWVLHGTEAYRLFEAITAWRKVTGFQDEFHFTDLNAGNLMRYREFVDLVMDNAAAISFKSATVERRGVGAISGAVGSLFYYLLAGGIDHESTTGRAPLPRTFQLWKDAEEKGYDKLLLANIRDRLTARFGDQLVMDVLEAVSSRGSPLMQVADLFTGSINRTINPPNPPPAEPGPKDIFAEFMLNVVGWTPLAVEGADLAVSVSI